MLEIDGTRGEGGGQVVRSSLALAAITGQAFRLDNVRARREKPGLQRQHLTAVKAAVAICGAKAEGCELGSRCLVFEPGTVVAGDYQFAIGSAGSTILVLQTILPALMLADGPSTVRLSGGTHNPLAPCFDFFDRVYLPLINAMGAHVSCQLDRYGFVPGGGGVVSATIQPTREPRGLTLMEAGKLVERRIEALVSNLPLHIAEREVETILQHADWKRASHVARHVESDGPGNVVMIELRYEQVSEVFIAFGRRGVPAERVAMKCLKESQQFVEQKVPVGRYLADQLLLPTSLAAHLNGRASRFRTTTLSDHSHTQIDLIKQFLDVDVEQQADDQGMVVTVRPVNDR